MKLLKELLTEETLATVRGTRNPKIKLTSLDKQIKNLQAEERSLQINHTLPEDEKLRRMAVINDKITKLQMKKDVPYDRSSNLQRRTPPIT